MRHALQTHTHIHIVLNLNDLVCFWTRQATSKHETTFCCRFFCLTRSTQHNGRATEIELNGSCVIAATVYTTIYAFAPCVVALTFTLCLLHSPFGIWKTVLFHLLAMLLLLLLYYFPSRVENGWKNWGQTVSIMGFCVYEMSSICKDIQIQIGQFWNVGMHGEKGKYVCVWVAIGKDVENFRWM